MKKEGNSNNDNNVKISFQLLLWKITIWSKQAKSNHNHKAVAASKESMTKVKWSGITFIFVVTRRSTAWWNAALLELVICGRIVCVFSFCCRDQTIVYPGTIVWPFWTVFELMVWTMVNWIGVDNGLHCSQSSTLQYHRFSGKDKGIELTVSVQSHQWCCCRMYSGWVPVSMYPAGVRRMSQVVGGGKEVMDADGGCVHCRLQLLYLATPMGIESAFGKKDSLSE